MSRIKRNTKCSLPLFPLPLVLFPGEQLPLHIFEPRYRAMLKDVMEGENLFGIVLTPAENSDFAEIGCTARVQVVQKLPDGRSNLLTLGSQRFKVVDIDHEKPYLMAKVEFLSDPACTDEAKNCAQKVRTAITDILNLFSKLNDGPGEGDFTLPEDVAELCYWVARTFYRSVEMRQKVLESTDLTDILTEQYLRLDEQRRVMAAEVAIKQAFQ